MSFMRRVACAILGFLALATLVYIFVEIEALALSYRSASTSIAGILAWGVGFGVSILAFLAFSIVFSLLVSMIYVALRRI